MVLRSNAAAYANICKIISLTTRGRNRKRSAKCQPETEEQRGLSIHQSAAPRSNSGDHSLIVANEYLLTTESNKCASRKIWYSSTPRNVAPYWFTMCPNKPGQRSGMDKETGSKASLRHIAPSMRPLRAKLSSYERMTVEHRTEPRFASVRRSVTTDHIAQQSLVRVAVIPALAELAQPELSFQSDCDERFMLPRAAAQ